MKTYNQVYIDSISGVLQRTSRLMLPPENITVAEWAEKYRSLDSMSSRIPGKWSHKMTPHLIEPMEAMSPRSGIQKVVLMFGSQLGKTEALFNTLLCYVDVDPCPIMIVLPTDDIAQAYSKTRLSPAIAGCKVSDIIKETKSRDGNNTISMKLFPGGSIRLAGANSPAPLAGFPVKLMLRDEVDRWPVDVGGEGSGLKLTEQRTVTYGDDKKVVTTSTPTIKGMSAIEMEFLNSDQRHYHVPCPHCGEYQELLWIGENEGREVFNFIFERNSSGVVVSAKYVCVHCGEHISEDKKGWMVNRGKYIAHNPGHSVAGFFCNSLNSLFESWIAIGQNWFDAQNIREDLKTFYNVKLAQCWEEKSSYIKHEKFKDRVEKYDRVPDEVFWITLAVDVQHDRLECEIRGWAPKLESWGLGYFRLWGDYREKEVWNQLEELVRTTHLRDDGLYQGVYYTMIDSSDGATQDYVYAFCKRMQALKKRVFPCKGMAREGLEMAIIHSRTKQKNGLNLIVIGSNTCKDESLFMLNVKDHGPGYAHFPDGMGYDDEYFKMLTAEQRYTEKDKKNRVKRYWKKVRERNEAWDVFNYGLAAMKDIQTSFKLKNPKPQAIKS